MTEERSLLRELLDELGMPPYGAEPPLACDCGSGDTPYDLLDFQGIYCGKTCDECEEEKMSHFRPEIFAGYSQADVDEIIEPEPKGTWDDYYNYDD